MRFATKEPKGEVIMTRRATISCGFILGIVAAVASVSWGTPGLLMARRDMSKDFGKRLLYTQTNLRALLSSGQERIIQINGRIDPDAEVIPFGSPAIFVRQGMRGSVFRINDKDYIVSHGRRLLFVEPDVATRVRRAVDEKSPQGVFDALPENEKKMVREGRVDVGMSRDGVLLAKSPYLTLLNGERYEIRRVRFRTVGDMTCTGAVESTAGTLPEIIQEVAAARVAERGTRADDRRSDTAMEDRKKAGYF